MIVLISGSRFADYPVMPLIAEELAQLTKLCSFEVVQGGADGIDALAKKVSRICGITCHEEAADWARLGLAAGRERNQRMLSKWKPKIALFFHHDPLLGSGTHDMFVRCRKAGVRTKVILYPES